MSDRYTPTYDKTKEYENKINEYRVRFNLTLKALAEKCQTTESNLWATAQGMISPLYTHSLEVKPWIERLLLTFDCSFEEIFPFDACLYKKTTEIDLTDDQKFGLVHTEQVSPFAQMAIARSLDTLSPRQKQVLICRFWLDMSLEETSRYIIHTDLNKDYDEDTVSRERIRQIEAKALRLLRHPTRSGNLKAALLDINGERDDSPLEIPMNPISRRKKKFVPPKQDLTCGINDRPKVETPPEPVIFYRSYNWILESTTLPKYIVRKVIRDLPEEDRYKKPGYYYLTKKYLYSEEVVKKIIKTAEQLYQDIEINKTYIKMEDIIKLSPFPEDVVRQAVRVNDIEQDIITNKRFYLYSPETVVKILQLTQKTYEQNLDYKIKNAERIKLERKIKRKKKREEKKLKQKNLEKIEKNARKAKRPYPRIHMRVPDKHSENKVLFSDTSNIIHLYNHEWSRPGDTYELKCFQAMYIAPGKSYKYTEVSKNLFAFCRKYVLSYDACLKCLNGSSAQTGPWIFRWYPYAEVL